MNCVQPGDPDYEADRRIANARFDYRPSQICYCATPSDVRTMVNKARDMRIPLRVRSGGHHHEGMCSGDGVAMIDLSQINGVTLSPDRTSAWIGAGARLGDVYRTLLANDRILPGGGCGDVRVGGLVQGGGWGLYARALGLTCDNVISFRAVLASGEIREVPSGEGGLFWAVCGGGGGNFAVVTEFRIALARVPDIFWQFTLTWTDPAMRQPVIEEWRANFPNDPEHRLTSFCRVSSAGGPDPPIIVAGNFLGDADTLVRFLVRALPSTYSTSTQDYSPVHQPAASTTSRMFHHPQYQPGPPQAAAEGLTETAEGPPTQTCDGGFYPHKVSSCYPRSTFSAAATRAITTFLDTQPAEPRARRYLSLHGLGGAVADPDATRRSCFGFREKPFMLQYQAWWGDPKDEVVQARCLAWIKGFRLSMESAGFTEGSFINFPDRDLPLASYYGGENFRRLIEVKRQYDPTNVFEFPMGIPTQ